MEAFNSKGFGITLRPNFFLDFSSKAYPSWIAGPFVLEYFGFSKPPKNENCTKMHEKLKNIKKFDFFDFLGVILGSTKKFQKLQIRIERNVYVS